MAGVRGEIPNKTFGDLLTRYALEVSAHKRGARWESIRIDLLKRNAIALVPLKTLDAPHVAAWRDRRLQEVSGASVRREWNLLSHACNIAVKEWRWLRSNPFQSVRRPKDAAPRDRILTAEDRAKLIEAAESPDQKRVLAAAWFAVETGMRLKEVCRLTAEDVSGAVAFIRESKTVPRPCPLSAEALRLIGEGAKVGPIFGYKEGALGKAWRELCVKAGVPDLHFHDLRHTAITQLAGKLDVLELARMVGIRDLRVLMVYFNKTAEDIAKRL